MILRKLRWPLLFIVIVVGLLYKPFGAIVQEGRRNRELIEAVEQDDTSRSLDLLSSGADPNASVNLTQPDVWSTYLSRWVGDFGRTMRRPGDAEPAIISAFEHTNIALIRTLISKGANVNVASDDQKPTLLLATLGGDTDFMKLVLDHGADVNARGRDGTTPLWSAAYYGKIPALKLLLDRKADPNAHGPDGTTPLMAAASNGKLEAINILLKRGAKVNAKSDKGKTALRYAREFHQDAIVDRLRDAGGD